MEARGILNTEKQDLIVNCNFQEPLSAMYCFFSLLFSCLWHQGGLKRIWIPERGCLYKDHFSLVRGRKILVTLPLVTLGRDSTQLHAEFQTHFDSMELRLWLEYNLSCLRISELFTHDFDNLVPSPFERGREGDSGLSCKMLICCCLSL